MTAAAADHAADHAADYARYRAALAGTRLPAAFVDLDCLDANFADLRRCRSGR